MWGHSFRVPAEDQQAFLAAYERLGPILERYAREWSLSRGLYDPLLFTENAVYATRDMERRAQTEFDDSEDYALVSRFVHQGGGLFSVEPVLGRRSLDFSPPVPRPDEMGPQTRRIWRLAEALSSRLAPHVPAATDVSPAWIFLCLDESFDEARDVAAAADARVELFLEQFQDGVSEDTTEPWPVWIHGEGEPFCAPEVVLREGALHIWFGDSDDPTLTLEPIPLTELEA